MGRSIGLDVHRDFCEVAIADGGRARSAGRIVTTSRQLELFAPSLAADDRVVLEATGNALRSRGSSSRMWPRSCSPHAKRCGRSATRGSRPTRSTPRVLADLLAADLIPPVWIGDERVRMLRRLVSRRRGLVKRRTQIKNEISAVLHRNLKGRRRPADPFGRAGPRVARRAAAADR